MLTTIEVSICCRSGLTIPIDDAQINHRDGGRRSGREAMIEECIAYHEAPRLHAHELGGETLQDSRTKKTSRGRKVLVTDGPYAETKEQLG
jgi:hypothetical protein